MAPQPVELHVVSDSTGETATRLVHALEAQFPDQPFEEIRHPMVESVADLAHVVRRARGRPAVPTLSAPCLKGPCHPALAGFFVPPDWSAHIQGNSAPV